MYLTRFSFCNSLILLIAVASGTLASWDRKRSRAWISTDVAILNLTSLKRGNYTLRDVQEHPQSRWQMTKKTDNVQL